MTTKNRDVPSQQQPQAEPFPHDSSEFIDYDLVEARQWQRRKPLIFAVVIIIIGFAGLVALFLSQK